MQKLGFKNCFTQEIDFNYLNEIKETCDRKINKTRPDLQVPKDVDFFKVYKYPTKNLRKLIMDYNINFEE